YWNDAWDQWSENPQAQLKRASELGQKALALDDSNSSALRLLSDVDWRQRRFDQSVAEAERAVAINPNYADGYMALADVLFVVGRPEDELRATEKAMRLDPASQDWYEYAVGSAYFQMGRYQEGVTALKRSVSVNPNFLATHLILAATYVELGRDQEARAEAAEVMRISPQFINVPPEKGPLKNKAFAERLYNDCRKAGLK
ncbi:MAG TPA: tetratricopeptide repeat protein, partial [Candidatus Binataceae bacterium]|nr:tetratricopeptide repeat protein [Candidatus Binataceae bacterium]